VDELDEILDELLTPSVVLLVATLLLLLAGCS